MAGRPGFTMQVEALTIACLPVEILELVFHLLPPRDRRAARGVSRWWREVAEVASLWTWVCFRLRRRGGEQELVKVMGSRRLEAAQGLEVRQVTEELLQAVIRHPGLRQLGLKDNDFTSIEIKQLVEALGKVEDVDLSFGSFTPHQVTVLFAALANGPASKLKKLNLKFLQFSTDGFMQASLPVEAEDVGLAVSRLEDADLSDLALTTLQAMAIFAILGGHRKVALRRLAMVGTNLSGVEPAMLARAVAGLKRCDLRQCCLTKEQVTTVLEASLTSTSLHTLRLGGNPARGEEALLHRARLALTYLEL